MNLKQLAAEEAAAAVQDGMLVGLGTGSTAHWAIRRLGERVREGLRIRCISTSEQSDRLARELGIEMITFADVEQLDVTIDGADEVNEALQLIKGGGGALLREKIVAAASRRLIIVADESKLVRRLGAFPLPVEVTLFGIEMTERKLRGLGCETSLREAEGGPFVTDNGNRIIDCRFGSIPDPEELHTRLNLIPGVVDNGLFIGMADEVILGCGDGSIKRLVRG